MKRILKRWFGRQVLAGPFAGMRYIGYSSGSTLMPKILGTYESELHPLLKRLEGRLNQTVIIVGAAEGYYAVGLLRMRPRLRIIAFEASEEGRAALQELARLNSVSDRLVIKESCDTEGLAQTLGSSPVDLVLMDVEGYESVLLDPAAVPSLRSTPILVELHNVEGLMMPEVMRQRFSSSHQIEQIAPRPRIPADIGLEPYRTLAKISSRARHALLWERGEDLGWLYLEPQTVHQGRA